MLIYRSVIMYTPLLLLRYRSKATSHSRMNDRKSYNTLCMCKCLNKSVFLDGATAAY